MSTSGIVRRLDEGMFTVYPYHSGWIVAPILLLLSAAFVPVGVLIIKESDSLLEVSVSYGGVNKYTYRVDAEDRYPHKFSFNGSNYSTGATTVISFKINETVRQPVYMQYRVTGFFQNYRRYRSSQDYNQLLYNPRSVSQDCEPFRYPGEVHKAAETGNVYFPCGSIAWSLFNDSFKLYKGNATSTLNDSELICDGSAFDADGKSSVGHSCRKNGIASNGDIKLFRSAKEPEDEGIWSSKGKSSSDDPYRKEGYYYGEPGHRIPSVRDEDFIVWASLSYTSEVTKMYRIIEKDLEQGDYKVEIVENFDVYSFKGEKYVVLTTRSWFGEKNHEMGITFLVVGCISFVLGLGVIIQQWVL